MKISFVLPPFSPNPIGGYQMVYRYANELCKRGNTIYIYYLAEKYVVKNQPWANVKTVVKKSFEKLNKKRLNLTWFGLDPDIKCFFHQSGKIREYSDAIIATSSQTADYVNEQSKLTGKKFYFIQGYESWLNNSDEFLKHTYKLPLIKIVPARWLQRVIREKSGENSIVIPNFVDDDVFFVSNSINNRDNIVSLLNHESENKNTQFGVAILKKVKEYVPDLTVLLFGVPEKPSGLPKYFRYYQQLGQQELNEKVYNKSKIYLMPPKHEGWGLTGMEAMASGTALIASDIGGIKEYAKNNSNSKLLKLNDFDGFVEAVVKLLRDDKSREKIVYQGLKDVKNFTVQASTDKWEEVLSGKLKNKGDVHN